MMSGEISIWLSSETKTRVCVNASHYQQRVSKRLLVPTEAQT